MVPPELHVGWSDCPPHITSRQDHLKPTRMDAYNRQDLPMDHHGAPLNRGEDPSAHEIKTEMSTPGAQARGLYSQHNNTVQFGEGATQQVSQFQGAAPTGPDLASALDSNRYTLYPSPKTVPEELLREPSGTSIAAPSSVLDEENGRTYAVHETGEYYLPNDAAEQDRLDLQHKIFTLSMNGALYRAPIHSPKNVLDIATGTGIWAIQFAREHPEANVVGTDLSMIQPLGVAENVQFFREDSEHADWNYPTPFDYIHLRCVLSCFDDHRTVIRKSFDNLNPGGWIELMDPVYYPHCGDGTLQHSNLERLFQILDRAMTAIGKDLKVARNYKQWLVEAGFVDVVEEVAPGPGNPWPTDPRAQEIGRWSMTNQYKGLRGMCWKVLRHYGMEADEIEDIVRLALNDIRDTRIHFYWPR
ncbi:hypothetical protein VMCG_04782 [Cytospora schulzeri]|uniref:Methyltransferase domain-containing protein n=1 Tax=Cytospora schulzeri TaxID=448051 RepID=A0A423WMX8_9PEZI|nr:hypothetical protein VMCG_04782 [Valsa malicola]